MLNGRTLVSDSRAMAFGSLDGPQADEFGGGLHAGNLLLHFKARFQKIH